LDSAMTSLFQIAFTSHYLATELADHTEDISSIINDTSER